MYLKDEKGGVHFSPMTLIHVATNRDNEDEDAEK